MASGIIDEWIGRGETQMKHAGYFPSRHIESFAGQDAPAYLHYQIAGVWHFYFPKKVYEEYDIFRNDYTGAEPVWTYDDHEVLSPQSSCKGKWKFVDCEKQQLVEGKFPGFQVELRNAHLPHDGFVARGIFSWSSDPIFTEWGGEVGFHAAQVAGVLFRIREYSPTETKMQLSDNVSIVNASGRELSPAQLEARMKEHAAGNRKQKEETLIPTPDEPLKWEQVGNFSGYRILGEDSNIFKYRHKLTNYGPSSLYNIIKPEEHTPCSNIFSGLSSKLLTVDDLGVAESAVSRATDTLQAVRADLMRVLIY
eukprot:GHVT01005544.1.p1 GENE.GHVT01005544.1~~GHVT01005544.1.p1  ORF type:complete len:309 (+),score=17.89 GHVT01005544.1:1394-2320(+)